ncbi:light-inducible protein CPRF2-like [Bidens hawaiensis]|uniref:light-inducible protein CPRF2-like n=1 Tax=Bidens hawaiensis TaxID=980011 RepID=UPI00404AE82F
MKSTPTPPIMNRSMSEWQFQCFLQQQSQSPSSSSSSSFIPNDQSIATTNTNTTPIDSEEYQRYLKTQLNLACAAVALTRESSSAAAETTQHFTDHGFKNPPPSKGDGPAGIPIKNNTVISVKSATSGSSRELSDDDELDGDTETTNNADPTDVKRVRRMISNRESARRSRRRKQDHLTELETQASKSRVENSALLKRLSDINQKYNEAAVDNRVLKADVETMRAKVKMAEESVKRITGFSPMVQPVSNLSAMGTMPSYYCIPSDASPDNMNQQQFHQGQLSSTTTNHHITPATQHTMLNLPPVENVQQLNPAMTEAGAQKMGRTTSMQYVATLEHLQKQFCGDVGSSCGTAQRGGVRK